MALMVVQMGMVVMRLWSIRSSLRRELMLLQQGSIHTNKDPSSSLLAIKVDLIAELIMSDSTCNTTSGKTKRDSSCTPAFRSTAGLISKSQM